MLSLRFIYLFMQLAVWKQTHHIYADGGRILLPYFPILFVTESTQVTKTSSLLGLVKSPVSYTLCTHKAISFKYYRIFTE
jgi:hypothetical protein